MEHKHDLVVPFGIITADDNTGSDVIDIVNDAIQACAQRDIEQHLLFAFENNIVSVKNIECRIRYSLLHRFISVPNNLRNAAIQAG